jgi:hypothetical protein
MKAVALEGDKSMRKIGMLALAFGLLPMLATAQEATAAEETTAAERDDRPQIRVLDNPYDLASFYRAQEPEHRYYPGDVYGPGGHGPGTVSGRYPIAGMYRGEVNPDGWSRFWTNGYTNVYTAGHGVGRQAIGYDYRRNIGRNGDLFLFAPTFLAPVGPLTDFFFYNRDR